MGGPYEATGFGVDVDLTSYGVGLTPYDVLFSESQGRAIVTCATDRVTALKALAQEHGVPAFHAGVVGAAQGPVVVRCGGKEAIAQPVARLREVYFQAIPRRMGD